VVRPTQRVVTGWALAVLAAPGISASSFAARRTLMQTAGVAVPGLPERAVEYRTTSRRATVIPTQLAAGLCLRPSRRRQDNSDEDDAHCGAQRAASLPRPRTRPGTAQNGHG